jgi:hypothetical protein
MNRVDDAVDRAADRLQALANELTAEGGPKAKLGELLGEDAVFLRKLKPSLIAARARGEAPTDQEPGTAVQAPSRPQLPKRKPPAGEGGPNPFVVVGAALAAGILLAKIIDWRSHAHPRD